MFRALGNIASRRPWFVIVAWIVVAVGVVAFAPTLEATSDQAEFLPDKYESIKAAELQADTFAEQATIGAIIVYYREDDEPLTDDDLAAAAAATESVQGDLGGAFEQVRSIPDPQDPSGPGSLVVPSPNRVVAFSTVDLAEDVTGYEPETLEAVPDLRERLDDAVDGSDLEVGLTGSVPQGYDSQEASGDALEIVGIATILLIVVLLAIIFRSVIITLMPVVVVFLVSMVATGLIATANELFDLKISSDVEVILLVVLYGIGTDYILFFLFRYRERLREGEPIRPAVAHALERAGEAIASAGGAVIVAFLALLLSSLGMFRAIGPALAIAVAVTLVAALTLVPAISAVLGRALFWPSKKYLVEPKGDRFAAVGSALGRRPALFAAVSGGLLVVLALFAIGFKPTFDLSDSGIPADAESSVAMEKFIEDLPQGAADPAYVMLRAPEGATITQEQATAFAEELAGAEGVAQAAPEQGSDDGRVWQIGMLLDHESASDEALEDVEGPVREAAQAAAPEGAEAFVGGTASVFVDFSDAMNRDYSVVFPVAALVILLILALLLRSLVAPWYLMVSVGLGFAATLGATVLVFQNIQGDSGLIFMLPIYIYLFVVALGTDYNILMIARLREEAREGHSSREAAARAVRHAGPTIAAAGLILAGTFASLMLGGNKLLVSMGFALSFGILVAAFVMSMFLTPALTALIGHAAWWPGHGDEKREAAEPAAEHDEEVPAGR